MDVSIGGSGKDGISSLKIFEPALRVITALGYCLLIVINYAELSTWWAYLGFTYLPRSALEVLLLAFGASLPAILLPARPQSIAQLAAWVLYFILFLPAMMIPPLQTYLHGGVTGALYLLVLLSTILMMVGARIKAAPFQLPQVSPRAFWLVTLSVYAAMNGTIILLFGASLQIVSIADVYTQRAAGGAIVGGSIIGYVIGNLAGAVNPFLMAVGIRDRRWLLMAAGVAGQFIVYSALAAKIVLLSVFVVSAAFFLFDRQGALKPNRIIWLMLALGAAGVWLIGTYTPFGGVKSDVTDILYMRTLYLPGVLAGVYTAFFDAYPLTYFSHSLVGLGIYDNPYAGYSIGQIIGNFVTPSSGYAYNNYNASFIAADGIASLGLVGIPVMIVVAVLLFLGVDKILGRVDFRVCCATFLPFILSLADSSLFTALLTSGGILLIFLLYMWGGTQPTVAIFDRQDKPSKVAS